MTLNEWIREFRRIAAADGFIVEKALEKKMRKVRIHEKVTPAKAYSDIQTIITREGNKNGI
jgi:hypothetical protein